MNRLVRLLVAATLAASGVWAGSVALPQVALACSCDGAPPLRDLFEKPGLAVLSGTVISLGPGTDQFGHTLGVLAVERVFKGDIPFNRVAVVSGGGGDCTMAIARGQHFVTAAQLEGKEVTPLLCMPFGDLATVEGQAVLAEAQVVFGPGIEPPPVPGQPTDTPATTESPAPDFALPLILLTVVGVTIAIFGAIAMQARRSGQAPQ